MEPEGGGRSCCVPGFTDSDLDKTGRTLRRVAFVPGQNLQMEEAARVGGQTGTGSDDACTGMDPKLAAGWLIHKTRKKTHIKLIIFTASAELLFKTLSLTAFESNKYISVEIFWSSYDVQSYC